MKKALLIFIFGFFTTIIFAQTKTELQTVELQKPILEYISKNFNGYSIDKVFKVDAKGVITYDVCVNKDKTHEKLFFDKDGKELDFKLKKVYVIPGTYMDLCQKLNDKMAKRLEFKKRDKELKLLLLDIKRLEKLIKKFKSKVGSTTAEVKL